MNPSAVLRIAAKELRYLAFSPIGWIVLAVFTIQSSAAFHEVLKSNFERLAIMRGPDSFSAALFMQGFPRPVFPTVTNNIYLYIPLLTMAVFARELHSGSIKLFMSSPLRSSEIVLGKYLAIAGFLLSFLVVMGVFTVISVFSVEDFDLPALLPGFLGVYLLACTYAAIGVFVSSLTKHQVIAAILTLAVLFILSSVDSWFQETPVLNEITHWASISGRARVFEVGLIATQHVVYFLAIIAVFIGFTVLRIADLRAGEGVGRVGLKAGGAALAAVAVGWALSLPQFNVYIDATYDRRNSLAPESVAIMERLQGPWEIETYANIVEGHGFIAWPRQRISDRLRYDHYRQHNHDLRMSYRLYYNLDANDYMREQNPDASDAQIIADYTRRIRLDADSVMPYEAFQRQVEVNLAEEDYRTIRVIRWNGESAVLRYFDDMQRFPGERTRAAALKRLLDGPVTIAVAAGHGERRAFRNGPEDMRQVLTRISSRWAMINHGFDIVETDLRAPVAAETDILILADPREDYDPAALAHIRDFIGRGGDMVLAVEADSAEGVDPVLRQLGLARGASLSQTHEEGYPQTLILASMADGVLNSYWGERNFAMPVGLPGAMTLTPSPQTGGFARTPILFADEAHGAITAANGTSGASAPVLAYALERQIDGERQRILVFGDADIFSTANSERRDPATISGVMDAFHHLTEGKYPVQRTRRDPIDDALLIERGAIETLRWLLIGALPLSILAAGGWILMRRRRR